MIAKNTTELKRAMQNLLYETMKDLTAQVHSLADEFISDWYDDYDPKTYKRTYQLLHSCIATDVKQSKNKFKSKVLLDYNSMHHNGLQKGFSEKAILDRADQGLHGTSFSQNGKKGLKLWQPTEKEISNTTFLLDKFREHLVSKGFSVEIK
ncbi:MAG: hypothetical protein K2F81_08830 [Ruminococcus sp.]|nr:hypothetical protein [Ruminococcus sp.]